MSSQLTLLVKMQKIDDQISELDVLKERKPRQLENLKACVLNEEQALNHVKKRIEDANLFIKTKETEIKTNNELKLKYSHQLDGIKNNKEYKALNSQIVILEEKNKVVETEILNKMEERDELEKEHAVCINNKKKADSNLKADEDRLKNEILKIDEDINRLKENRSDYAKQLPMAIVKKYVMLIKNKNRKAVIFSSNNACSGCGFHIRPQILIELNTPDKIIYCENCGRILVRSLDEN